MENSKENKIHDLPKIGAPATRALLSIGIKKLEQLKKVSEDELLALHGFGPKALRILQQALANKGLAFKSEK